MRNRNYTLTFEINYYFVYSLSISLMVRSFSLWTHLPPYSGCLHNGSDLKPTERFSWKLKFIWFCSRRSCYHITFSQGWSHPWIIMLIPLMLWYYEYLVQRWITISSVFDSLFWLASWYRSRNPWSLITHSIILITNYKTYLYQSTPIIHLSLFISRLLGRTNGKDKNSNLKKLQADLTEMRKIS